MMSTAVVKPTEVSGQTGGVSESCRQVRFSDANSSQENYVGFVGHEGQAEEVLHLWSIDLLGPAPLKVFQEFDGRKASRGDASLDCPLVPGLALAIDEPSQIIDVSPMLLRGFRGQCGVRLMEVTQTHLLELLLQTLVLFVHAAPPSSRW